MCHEGKYLLFLESIDTLGLVCYMQVSQATYLPLVLHV